MTNFNTLIGEESFSVVRLHGEGSRNFLNGQTTADLSKTKEGILTKACWLNTKGKVKALLEICFDSEGAEIIVLLGKAESVIEGFDKVVFPADKVEIVQLDKILRIQAMPLDYSLKEKGVFWLKEDQSIPNELASCQRSSYREFNLWKINYGIPIGTGEIEFASNPFELGLEHLISNDKGCYLGQEAIARLIRSGKIRQKLVCWESDFDLKIGEKIGLIDQQAKNKKIFGTITSSIEDRSGQKRTGLALIKSELIRYGDLFSMSKNHKLTIKPFIK